MPSINYEDDRFSKVENDKQNALDQSNGAYDDLIDQSKGHYDDLINQSKDWADKQAEIQNEQKDFLVGKIEQQKDQAEKDYTREQKGAYQDYMKQQNAYGSNMQAAGQQGLGGSGWSETIQSGFYNTYQNRYAKARESYNEVVMNYNNNIKEAELQNSSALASIYADAQAKQLELALQSFTVIKDLTLAKQNAYMTIDAEFNDRWRETEQQINTENALAEQIRQYNESLAEQKRQADMDNAYRQQQLALEREQFNYQKSQASRSYSGGGSGGGGGTYLSDGSSGSAVNTAYYQGALNKDAKNGTFKNGYQPDNINGKKLSKTGDTITFKTQTLSGQKQTVTQNIWKAGGKKYYWDGRKNAYIQIK